MAKSGKRKIEQHRHDDIDKSAAEAKNEPGYRATNGVFVMAIRLAARRPVRHRPPARADVQARANGYCLTTYGDAYIGATPHRLALPSGHVWVTAVMFTSPGYGHVGEVGVVALDGKSLAILDATPRDEVRAAGVRLAREKRDALNAAFRRARTT